MGAIRTGLAGYSPRVQVVGVSFWITWITLMYSTEPLIPGSSDTDFAVSLAFVVSTLTLALCLMAASLMPQKVAKILARPRMVFGLSLLASIATLLILSSGLVPMPVVVISAMITGGVTSLIALRAALLFAEIDTKNMLLSMCAVLILGVLMYSFAEMLTLHGMRFLSLAVLLLCLPACALWIYLQHDAGADTPEEQGWSGRPRSLWRLAAYAVVLMFMLSVIRGYYPNYIDSAQFAASRGVVAVGLILGGVAVSLVVAAIPRDASFGTLCYVLLFVSVFVGPAMSFLRMDPTVVGNVSAVLFGMVMLCIWGLSCRISFRSGQSALCVVGMTFGAACLGATLGFAVGTQLDQLAVDMQAMAHVSLVSLAVCVAAVLVLLRRSDIIAFMEPVEDASAQGEGSTDSSDEFAALAEGARLGDVLRKLCAFVALEYGLTPREADVFQQLVMGKDAKAIAEELFISFNTVRSHIRRVYAKLDVHSRGDLMTVVSQAADKLKTF